MQIKATDGQSEAYTDTVTTINSNWRPMLFNVINIMNFDKQ